MKRAIFVFAGMAFTGLAHRVQTDVGRLVSDSARDWELENVAQHRAGEINDAELGLANLKKAMHDPSLLAEVAQMLRQPEGRAELVKMMVNPEFQQQAKIVFEKMRASG